MVKTTQAMPAEGDEMSHLQAKLREAWTTGDLDAADVSALTLAVDCILRRRASAANVAARNVGNAWR